MFNHTSTLELKGMVKVSINLVFKKFLFILQSNWNNLSDQPTDRYLEIYSFLPTRFLKTIFPSK